MLKVEIRHRNCLTTSLTQIKTFQMLAFDINSHRVLIVRVSNFQKRNHQLFKEIYLKMQKLLKKLLFQNRKWFNSNKDLMVAEMEFWSKTHFKLSKCQWSKRFETLFLQVTQSQACEVLKQSKRKIYSSFKSIMINRSLLKWMLCIHLQLQIFPQKLIIDKIKVILENELFQQKEMQQIRALRSCDTINIHKQTITQMYFTQT